MMVKAICADPFSAACNAGCPLDVARDVSDHDDRVVDDEAVAIVNANQREVVEAEPRQIHTASVPTARAAPIGWDQGRRRAAQKHKDHDDDEDHGEAELELDIGNGARIVRGASVSAFDIDSGRKRALSCGNSAGSIDDHLDDIGAGLALDVLRMIAWSVFQAGAWCSGLRWRARHPTALRRPLR